ncbi:hypothetical protein O6H91_03G121300 [Diphasiastrum complanatum]|uniref:Uncharacterized protein n=1 Tax=Diphasiastrum complanatum TaxID=34168 RepID=A0ACC2EB28_DIPCM|nr:hypothetical protein O6H91_03G121300 [Diphasiastrum complanatum]
MVQRKGNIRRADALLPSYSNGKYSNHPPSLSSKAANAQIQKRSSSNAQADSRNNARFNHVYLIVNRRTLIKIDAVRLSILCSPCSDCLSSVKRVIKTSFTAVLPTLSLLSPVTFIQYTIFMLI